MKNSGAPEPAKKLKYPEDFANVLEEWRKRHQLREDEPLLLCLELFRVHQEHWDEIRRKEMPSFADFRDSLIQLQQHANLFHRYTSALLEELRRYPEQGRLVNPTVGGLAMTAIFCVLTGILIGRFLL